MNRPTKIQSRVLDNVNLKDTPSWSMTPKDIEEWSYERNISYFIGFSLLRQTYDLEAANELSLTATKEETRQILEEAFAIARNQEDALQWNGKLYRLYNFRKRRKKLQILAHQKNNKEKANNE